MQKNGNRSFCRKKLYKPLLAMKITFMLLLVSVFQLSASVYSQNTRFDMKLANKTLIEVFEEIRNNSEFSFVYDLDDVESITDINVSEQEATVEEILNSCLEDTNLTYEVIDKVVVVKQKPYVAPKSEQQEKKEIKGKVTDRDGIPLPGVSVVIKGTNVGVATNVDGEYVLEMEKNNAILIFSFVGMLPQEVVYNEQSVQNITLSDDSKQMAEVVVTGYATISRERATGSYSKIASEDLEIRPSESIGEVIGSTVAGVQQGENGNIVIRGVGSFKAETAPLVVVDGFAILTPDPFESVNPTEVASVTFLKDAAATSIYGARAANGVIVITTKTPEKGKFNVEVNSFVNVSERIDLDHALNMAGTEATIKYMEDIEKFVPSPGISYWRDPYTNPSRYSWDVAPHVAMMFERRNGNISQEEYNAQREKLIAQDGIWKKQYEDHLLRNRVYQNHNLTITSATDKSSSKFSLSYAKDLTHYKYNNSDRYQANFTNVYNVNPNIKVGITFNGIYGKNQMNGTNISEISSVTSPYTRLLEENGDYAYMAKGIYLPYLENGTIDESIFPYSWRYNILEEAKARDNNSSNYNLRFNGFLDVKIMKGLSANFSFQYEMAGNKTENYLRENSYYYRSAANRFSVLDPATGIRNIPNEFIEGDAIQTSSNKTEAYNFRSQLNFDREFNGKHRITALAGFEAISTDVEVNSTTTRPGFNERTYTTDRYVNYELRLPTFEGSNSYMPWSLGGYSANFDRYVSGYFNASYTLDSKYTLTSSARIDGSNFVADDVNSKISPFWSVGALWNMNKEAFIKDNLSFVDLLRLKVTYGVGGIAAGKRSVSTVSTLSTYQLNQFVGAGENASYIYNRAIADLTWEKAYTLNISADFSMFEGKLYGSLGYYNKDSRDVLMNTPVSYVVGGTNSLTLNSGNINNKGVEIELGSRLNITKDISWTGNLNFTYNKNTVVEWDLDRPYVNTYVGGGYPVKGQSLNTVYAFKLKGYSDEGLAIVQLNDGTEVVADSRNNTMYYSRFDESKGESITNNNNYTKKIGTLTAPMFGGFRSSLKAYGFTLSAMLSGEFGHIFKRNDDYGYSATNSKYTKSLEKAWHLGDDASKFTYRPYPNAANASYLNSGYTNLYYSNVINAAESNYENASHIRLKEIYLGYEIPVKKIAGENSKITRANVYFQVKNLGVVWTANDKGLDPYYLPGTMKTPTQFTFGLKLNL